MKYVIIIILLVIVVCLGVLIYKDGYETGWSKGYNNRLDMEVTKEMMHQKFIEMNQGEKPIGIVYATLLSDSSLQIDSSRTYNLLSIGEWVYFIKVKK